MSETLPINSGIPIGNGSVTTSSSPITTASGSNNDKIPLHLQHHQQQQPRQTKDITSELNDLNENTWFRIGKKNCCYRFFFKYLL